MKAMKFIILAGLLLFSSVAAFPQESWQKMGAEALKKAVPEKAPVLEENIETEMRTASGISMGSKNIFGVLIITAGYEADGKYTHYFKNEAQIRFKSFDLAPGEYVFGYKREDGETLRVCFYNAKSGELIGATDAKLEKKKGAIYSFLIEPPIEKKGKVYIGRFSFEYTLD